MQAPTQNAITVKAHGSSQAVDHDSAPDKTIYAPEDGTIDSYQQRGSGKSDAGLALRMRGGTGLHQFAHTSKSLVSVGQKVKRGQPIAIMGNTGYVQAINGDGTHLHYWLQRPDGSYVYPPTLYTESFIKLGGDTMSDPITDKHKNLIRIVSSEVRGWDRGQVHSGKFDKTEMAYWKGKSIADFIQQCWDVGAEYRVLKDKWQAAYDREPELQKRLAAKPKEVIKEVENPKTLTDLQVSQEKNVELGRVLEIKSDEITKLQAEVAAASGDTQLLNSFGEFLAKLIARLGLRK